MKKQINVALALGIFFITWLFISTFANIFIKMKYSHRYSVCSSPSSSTILLCDTITGECWSYYKEIGDDFATRILTREGWSKIQPPPPIVSLYSKE